MSESQNLANFESYLRWVATVRPSGQYWLQDAGNEDNCFTYRAFIADAVTPNFIHGRFWNGEAWQPIEFSRKFGIADLNSFAVFLVPDLPENHKSRTHQLFYSIFPIADLEQYIETLQPAPMFNNLYELALESLLRRALASQGYLYPTYQQTDEDSESSAGEWIHWAVNGWQTIPSEALPPALQQALLKVVGCRVPPWLYQILETATLQQDKESNAITIAIVTPTQLPGPPLPPGWESVLIIWLDEQELQLQFWHPQIKQHLSDIYPDLSSPHPITTEAAFSNYCTFVKSWCEKVALPDLQKI